jgi:hypothetical protein
MLIWVGVSAAKIEQDPANQLYFYLQYHTLIMRLLFFRPPLAQGGAYVNGPEILHLIRHDLQRAIAPQPKPPTPRPMDASPWLAISAMQKAIRRGREDLALSAAATLLRDAPDKLWRRVGCIAYEDVGLASLEAVGVATVALTGKRHRSALGGEWAVASCIVAVGIQAAHLNSPRSIRSQASRTRRAVRDSP